jgi:hypothetical protein
VNNFDAFSLADGRKQTPFVIVKTNNLLQEKIPVKVYLNVMRKGG